MRTSKFGAGFLPLALLAAVWLLASPPAAAQGYPHEYQATCSGTDAGAGQTCTLQLPAAAARFVVNIRAYVQCADACSISQTRDGSAAANTAVTVRKLNPNAAWVATPVAEVYSDSDVGSGTATGPATVAIPASPGYMILDAAGTILEAAAAGVRNYNVTVTLTGDYEVTFFWEERANY